MLRERLKPGLLSLRTRQGRWIHRLDVLAGRPRDPDGGRLPLAVPLLHFHSAPRLPFDVHPVHDLWEGMKQLVGVALWLVFAQLIQPDDEHRQGPAQLRGRQLF